MAREHWMYLIMIAALFFCLMLKWSVDDVQRDRDARTIQELKVENQALLRELSKGGR